MCASLIFAAVAAITCISLSSGSKESLRFDDNFLFGVATAAYQVEGAWNEDGKGETIWDHVLHEHPEYIADKENGDLAADSYHQYARDVEMVKEMNMDFYRFSISWARVLPNGDMSILNEKGLKYYSDLIDELLANGIEPVVTMYHWDLPYALQELGGWANRHIALYFRDYADLLYSTFGNRVKWWITFNEPQAFCPGYSGEYNVPPSVKMSGVGNYLCGHTVLLAHAYAYHLYNELYRSSQKGEVGITYSAGWSIPKTELDPDIAAADRSMQFWLGWFAHPIVSHGGDYPQVMRQRISENSRKEGLRRSRLPHFTQEEIQWIRGTADFVGVNHYTSHYAADGEGGKSPSFFRDAGIKVSQNSSWPSTGSAWLKVTPTGFRDLLNWIQNSYKIPKILITENGYSDKEGYLNDTDRIEYFKLYLAEIHKAKYIDGVNVIGYTAWSLMDNFEWLNGYTEKFGLYHVDFSSSQRTRSPKESARYFGEVAKTHRISRAISNYNVSFTLYFCFFICAVIRRMI